MAATSTRDPIVVASAKERTAIAKVERLLEASSDQAILIGPDGVRTDLPASLYAVLLRAVHQLTIGNGVSILPAEFELTTQRAADILNVSRPFVIKLIGSGDLPHHLVGTHRRLRLSDVLAYKTKRDAARRQTLDAMVREAEEMGAYDAFYAAGRALTEEGAKKSDVGRMSRRERADPISRG